MIRAALERMPITERSTLATVDMDRDGRITIPCGAARHRATIHNGSFVLLDHDLDAELPLFVFGSDLAPCLVYHAAWNDAFADDFLAAWAVDAEGDRARRDREDWFENYWEAWPSDPSPARALFGPALQVRLAMDVAQQWITSRGADGPGGLWRVVRQAIAIRARRAFVLSLASVDAHRRPDALVPVRISVAPEGAPSVSGRLGRSGSNVTISLPVHWLWTVWRTGALHDGDFVVARTCAEVATIQWRASGGPSREHLPRMVIHVC